MARDPLFLVEEHPFRSVYPEMSSIWLTESARWCAVFGIVLSLFFLLRGKRLAPKLKTYQGLSWLNLAALLGMIASLPFAPPWDGETRIFAATLPLFFLLPASGVGGLYLAVHTGQRGSNGARQTVHEKSSVTSMVRERTRNLPTVER